MGPLNKILSISNQSGSEEEVTIQKRVKVKDNQIKKTGTK
jgi:hypothetical protein